MTRARTVLISGAGIAGPSLAYWLLHRGFAPTLIERASAFRTGGYMVDFWGVGYDVAERMELIPALRAAGYFFEEVRIVDARGRRIAGFDARVFQNAAGGDRFFSILRGDLAACIYQLVTDQVETIFGDTITDLVQDDRGVAVTFAHASPRRFDLVVGADGLHSAVRAVAFGARPEAERFLGYYVAAFSTDAYPHRDEGAYISYDTPGNQIARYALRDGRSAFLFVFAEDAPLAVDAHDAAAQRAVLHERFDGAGWESREILDAMDGARDLYFDAVAQVRLPTWHQGRVVLLGDAAYCPSLLAGQGSAFAMAGAYVLAWALERHAGDHAAAFAEYERRFKPFVDEKQRAAVRFAPWFAPKSKMGLAVRNWVTNALSWPVVSKLTAKRMFGDQFELP